MAHDNMGLWNDARMVIARLDGIMLQHLCEFTREKSWITAHDMESRTRTEHEDMYPCKEIRRLNLVGA